MGLADTTTTDSLFMGTTESTTAERSYPPCVPASLNSNDNRPSPEEEERAARTLYEASSRVPTENEVYWKDYKSAWFIRDPALPARRATFSRRLDVHRDVIRAIILAAYIAACDYIRKSKDLSETDPLPHEDTEGEDMQRILGIPSRMRMPSIEFDALVNHFTSSTGGVMPPYSKAINIFWYFVASPSQRRSLFYVPGFVPDQPTEAVVEKVMRTDGGNQLICDMLIYHGTGNCDEDHLLMRVRRSLLFYGYPSWVCPRNNARQPRVFAIYKALVVRLALEPFFAAVERSPFPPCVGDFVDGRSGWWSCVQRLRDIHIPDFYSTCQRVDLQNEMLKYTKLDERGASRLREEICRARGMSGMFPMEDEGGNTPVEDEGVLTEEEEEEEEELEQRHIPVRRSYAFVASGPDDPCLERDIGEGIRVVAEAPEMGSDDDEEQDNRLWGH